MHDLAVMKHLNNKAQRRFNRQQKKLKEKINEELRYFVEIGLLRQVDVDHIFNATMKSLIYVYN